MGIGSAEDVLVASVQSFRGVSEDQTLCSNDDCRKRTLCSVYA